MSTTAFDSNEICCIADFPSPSQVRARIEVLVKQFLVSLSASCPSICNFSLVCRNASNTFFREGFSDVDAMLLSRNKCEKTLLKLNGVKSFIRVWMVLALCYELLGLGKKVTQREMFYKLLSDAPEYFATQRQVNETIQDVVALLQCARHSLGIIASSRGAIIGRIQIEDPGREFVDCTCLGSSGQYVTGDINVLQRLVFKSDARYILVVEKDAIFQRLSEDKYFQSIPSIIITGKGFPDLASRALLHRLTREFPNLPVLALVDWNPFGLSILCTYKFGSINMGLETPHYVCNVKWLGIRSTDLGLIPPEALIDLTRKDRQLANALLKSNLLQNYPDYKSELQKMLEIGYRVEIEALYVHGYQYLLKYVTDHIMHMDYI